MNAASEPSSSTRCSLPIPLVSTSAARSRSVAPSGTVRGVLHDPAVVQDVEDLDRGHAGAQNVFPRLQTRRHAVGLGIQDEGQGMADQTGVVELSGNLLQARAPAYLDDLLFRLDGGRLVDKNPSARKAEQAEDDG